VDVNELQGLESAQWYCLNCSNAVNFCILALSLNFFLGTAVLTQTLSLSMSLSVSLSFPSHSVHYGTSLTPLNVYILHLFPSPFREEKLLHERNHSASRWRRNVPVVARYVLFDNPKLCTVRQLHSKLCTVRRQSKADETWQNVCVSAWKYSKCGRCATFSSARLMRLCVRAFVFVRVCMHAIFSLWFVTSSVRFFEGLSFWLLIL